MRGKGQKVLSKPSFSEGFRLSRLSFPRLSQLLLSVISILCEECTKFVGIWALRGGSCAFSRHCILRQSRWEQAFSSLAGRESEALQRQGFFREGGNAVDTKKFFRGGEKVLKNYRSFANSSVDGRMRLITLSPLRKVERTLIFLLAKVFLRARPPPSASLDDEINKAFWIHSRLSSMRTYHRKSRLQNDLWLLQPSTRSLLPRSSPSHSLSTRSFIAQVDLQGSIWLVPRSPASQSLISTSSNKSFSINSISLSTLSIQWGGGYPSWCGSLLMSGCTSTSEQLCLIL